MKQLVILSLILWALCIQGFASGNYKQIPTEYFFRESDGITFKLSPNGEYLSCMASWKDRQNIFIIKTDSILITDSLTHVENWKRVSTSKDRNIDSYFWINNSEIGYLKDIDGSENTYLTILNIHTQKETAITKIPGVKTTMINLLPSDNNHIIIGLNQRDKEIFDLYKLDLTDYTYSIIYENNLKIQDWFFDHKGNLRLGISTDGVNQVIYHKGIKEDTFKLVLSTSFKETFDPVVFDFTNDSIMYGLSDINRDLTSVVKFNVYTGKEKEVLFGNEFNDISEINYSIIDKKITEYSWYSVKKERFVTDEKLAQTYKNIQDKIGKLEFSIISGSKDEQKYIIEAYSDKVFGQYYLYEKETNELRLIHNSCAWLDPEQMCDMQPIVYQTRDKELIHGYLTIPKGDQLTKLPLIVVPHGGPWDRDYWRFDPNVQFLANRGYAVFQMNYRGSTTYGKRFWRQSFKQWGLLMQNDISDGVQWLIQEGIADPKRIAILGGSYGGYAVLSGVTTTPELYKGGIDFFGLSDLLAFMKLIPPYWKPYLSMMSEMIGDPEKDYVMLHEASPINHVQNITVPLLIFQGKNDVRVTESQSETIVNALKKNNIPVEYVVFPDEGHGFSLQKNRILAFEQVAEFLQKILKNK